MQRGDPSMVIMITCSLPGQSYEVHIYLSKVGDTTQCPQLLQVAPSPALDLAKAEYDYSSGQEAGDVIVK